MDPHTGLPYVNRYADYVPERTPEVDAVVKNIIEVLVRNAKEVLKSEDTCNPSHHLFIRQGIAKVVRAASTGYKIDSTSLELFQKALAKYEVYTDGEIRGEIIEHMGDSDYDGTDYKEKFDLMFPKQRNPNTDSDTALPSENSYIAWVSGVSRDRTEEATTLMVSHVRTAKNVLESGHTCNPAYFLSDSNVPSDFPVAERSLRTDLGTYPRASRVKKNRAKPAADAESVDGESSVEQGQQDPLDSERAEHKKNLKKQEEANASKMLKICLSLGLTLPAAGAILTTVLVKMGYVTWTAAH